MSMLMSARGSSRRKRRMSFQRGAYTTTVSSPRCEWVSSTSAGNFCLIRSTSAFAISHQGARRARAPELHETGALVLARIAPGFDRRGGPIAARDLVHQEHETVEHRFRAGRTARHVDVAGDDLVEAGYARVVVVEAAAGRAGAEREHPLGLRHLLVDAAQDRGLALHDGADDPEQIRLARREARGLRAEAREVV